MFSNNHYYTHLKDKSFARCLILLVPFFGNIAVGIYDFATRKNKNERTLDELERCLKEFKDNEFKGNEFEGNEFKGNEFKGNEFEGNEFEGNKDDLVIVNREEVQVETIEEKKIQVAAEKEKARRAEDKNARRAEERLAARKLEREQAKIERETQDAEIKNNINQCNDRELIIETLEKEPSTLSK